MAIMNRKQKVSDEIPTASMADIAFLLLVFFLTTTVFNEERGLPIVLPEQAEEVDVAATNLIFFVVQPDGTVIVRRGESEQEQTISHTAVANILRQELAANDNLIAAIQTHPEAPYRHMVNVLDQVKLTDAERISLQELEN